MLTGDREQAPEFDADLAPDNQQNQEAAKFSGLWWNPHERTWDDEDGCPVRDEFGQPL